MKTLGTLLKIIITCAVIFFIIYFLVTCSAFLKKMDIHEVETYSYKEFRIKGGKHVRISTPDKEHKDVVLVSLLRENGFDEDAYLIADKKGVFLSGEYENERTLFEGGKDLEYFFWQGRYIFAVNDENCTEISIINVGEKKIVKCGRLPFIYISDEEPESFSFLNSSGKALN